MANICDTTYVLGGSPAVVKDFIGTIDALVQKNRDNVADLDDLAKAYDIDAYAEKLDARGYVLYHDDMTIDDNGKAKVVFHTESKWAACSALFDRIKDNLGDVTLSYLEIESGCEIFTKHDEDDDFIDDECFVDVYGGDNDVFDGEGYSDTTTFEDAVDDWFKVMNIERPHNKSYDELIEFINDYEDYDDEDAFYQIHPLEVV